MAEYWTIIDKFGRSNKLYRDGDTMPSLAEADRWDPGGSPHRVIHLIEAGNAAAVLEAARRYVRKLEPADLNRYETPLERLILAVRAMEDDDG